MHKMYFFSIYSTQKNLRSKVQLVCLIRPTSTQGHVRTCPYETDNPILFRHFAILYILVHNEEKFDCIKHVNWMY